MRYRITAGIVVLALELVAAQKLSNLHVLQIHYEVTTQRDGYGETVTETGIYHMSQDGRHRVDRRPFNRSPIFEIEHPDGLRIVGHPSRKRAFVAKPGAVPMIPPSPDSELRLVPSVPDLGKLLTERAKHPGQIVGNLSIGPNQEPLGARVVDGLELEGVRQVGAMPDGTVFSSEMWFYFHESAHAPVMAEYHLAGGGILDVKRITSVTAGHVSPDYFDAPDDYMRMESPRPRRLIDGLR